MNKRYNLKLDLQFRCNNSTMRFNEFDNNTSDFYIEITKGNSVIDDLNKATVVLATIKPSTKVEAQFIDVTGNKVYADLKPNMRDEVGTYKAKAMIIFENERIVTDTITYEVKEDSTFRVFNENVTTNEEYTLLTEMLSRLSIIETTEEQRQINEANRILQEEQRQINETTRIDNELNRQHEEADRAKYDATRESNEEVRKSNELTRQSNENIRLQNESSRVIEEEKRVAAEEERNANYNFMTEDEERRRYEANQHKVNEDARKIAETDRVNEEAKRRTVEQSRVSSENTRVKNETTRESNEEVRKSNEISRVDAETQRQNRYNSFISNAENVANNFENYTKAAKEDEEQRKSSETDRKTFEERRKVNESARITKENERVYYENSRVNAETKRENDHSDRVSKMDKATADFSSNSSSALAGFNTVSSNAVNTFETNANKSINEFKSQTNGLVDGIQADYNSLQKIIIDENQAANLQGQINTINKEVMEHTVSVEGSYISVDGTKYSYLKNVQILGNTVQGSNLADIKSVGDKVEGQSLYRIPLLSVAKNIASPKNIVKGYIDGNTNVFLQLDTTRSIICKVNQNTNYVISFNKSINRTSVSTFSKYPKFGDKANSNLTISGMGNNIYKFVSNADTYVVFYFTNISDDGYVVQLEEGTQATTYEAYKEDKLTILSPVQLEKGDVLKEVDGVWGVEKNRVDKILKGVDISTTGLIVKDNVIRVSTNILNPASKPSSEVFCNVIPNRECYDYDYDGIDSHSNSKGEVHFSVLKSKLETYDIAGVRKFVDNANMLIKYETATPTFIPLPHSQQIKLRTFANKTNISFLTEIEGTIKADVPKSLGAVVNVHTKEIDNIYTELDRVKKLEQSTVSTVTTDKDFVSVQETSNGYFEDVELKGRTLVNLSGLKSFSQTVDPSGYSEYRFNEKYIKQNTEYTIVYLADKSDPKITLQTHLNGSMVSPVQSGCSQGINIIKHTSSSEITGFRFRTLPGVSIPLNITNIMLLEGDHTQSPPSYFEGLKSVGEGTDEIVVSSVDGLMDVSTEFATIGNKLSHRVNTKYKAYSTLRFENISNKNISVERFSKSTELYVDEIALLPGEIKDIDVATNYVKWISFNTTIGWTNSQCSNLYKNVVVNGKTDKKKLLYFDPTDNTWKKPVLDEFSTVKKGSDGVYRYYKRGEKVVLNGSEDWKVDGSNDVYIRFYIPTTYAKPICDKFKYLTYNEYVSYISEGITYTANSFNVCILKSKLTTQDVAGFKAWLQANNVTVVYQLAQEKVYECTNIDLITYENETNFNVKSGVLSPKTTLKVHSNISNVVSLLQKKVSLLESSISKYMITQNRLQLASTYSADSVTFKVDFIAKDAEEYNQDLYNLILANILVGKENYDYDKMFNITMDYASWLEISWDQFDILVGLMDYQYYPPIEEETPVI